MMWICQEIMTREITSTTATSTKAGSGSPIDSNNSGSGVRDLDVFHLAAHAIGDFYAHSSYGEFGGVEDGRLAIYDPDEPSISLPHPPDYGKGSQFDIASGNFSINEALWKGAPQAAATLWKGKLISGRYAQKDDPNKIF